MVRAFCLVAVVATVTIAGVYFLVEFIPDSPSENAERYAEKLRDIAAEVPVDPGQNSSHRDRLSASSWTEQAVSRLAILKANVQTTELIARDVEQELATKSSGCILAKTVGVDKKIAPAKLATRHALDALLAETNDRIRHLTDQDAALGWTGWRGSREEEIDELMLLAHDIETTMADAVLAFYRLENEVSALGRMSFTCSPLRQEAD